MLHFGILSAADEFGLMLESLRRALCQKARSACRKKSKDFIYCWRLSSDVPMSHAERDFLILVIRWVSRRGQKLEWQVYKDCMRPFPPFSLNFRDFLFIYEMYRSRCFGSFILCSQARARCSSACVGECDEMMKYLPATLNNENGRWKVHTAHSCLSSETAWKHSA